MRRPDDVIERASKHLISLPHRKVEPFLDNHLATANYTVSAVDEPKVVPKANDKTFYTNNDIWEAIIYEQIRRTDINIILDGFFLFEWLPRSPGLFYTPRGRDARIDAQHNIETIRDGVIIYNPHGKGSMLDGGIGNVRLKPIQIKENTYCLMSASSSGICHEGFPIAVPIELYNECIDDITDRGAVVRKLIGRLRFIPDDLRPLYEGYAGVPQLCLHIEDVLPTNYPQSRHMADLWVSVATSFLSNYEGSNRVYATYVSFDPSERNSFRKSVEWMEQDYVIGKYRGQVLTDFDQQKSNFATAPFSLEKVMSLSLVEAEVRNFADRLYIDADSVLKHQSQVLILIGEVYMDSKYKILGGQQGSVGDNSPASDFTQISSPSSDTETLSDLATQLSLLRAELKKKAKEEEDAGNDTSKYDVAIGSVVSAKDAADKGDESKVRSYLASAGEWVADFATKVGVSLVTELIKKETGLK